MQALRSGQFLIAYLSRFSLIGVLATLTYLVVANILLFATQMAATLASVLAYSAGMVVSFLGQSRFTFQVARNTWGQVARFVFLSLVGLLISYVAVDYAVNTLDVAAFWGTLVTAVTIPILSFVAMKLWVFK